MNPLLIALTVLAVALILIPLLCYACGILLYRRTLRPPSLKKRRAIAKVHRDHATGTAFDAPHDMLTIQSRDELSLYAFYFKRSESKVAILCHGYKGYPTELAPQLAYFLDRGYSVLMPIARGHGESEGRFIGMGFAERFDIVDWCKYVTHLLPRASILLFGHSMGAATVMMASGEDALPESVVCMIEDCGYTSVYDEFSVQIKELYHLPVFPFLTIANRIARKRMGYDFKEASSLEQIRHCRIPTLLIHGEKDTFVPTAMVYPLYDAVSAAKELLIVPNAAHAVSVTENPTLYFEAFDRFLARYMKTKA